MKKLNIKIMVAVLCLLIFPVIESKILVITQAFNRPDFIEIQHRTFQTFLKDDYQFVVFNDARDQKLRNQIKQTCSNLGLSCHQIPQEIHDRPYLQRWPNESLNHPSVRNVNGVQYSLDTIGFDHNDIVMLLDSDMFLIKPFSIRKFMKGYDLGGRKLTRLPHRDIEFLWHGFAFLDMRVIPDKKTLNFNCGKIHNTPVDAGGYSYYYLKNHPRLKVRFVNRNFVRNFQCENCSRQKAAICLHNTKELEAAGFDHDQITLIHSIPTGGPYESASIEFFLNNSFLHYRCGSNWDNKSHDYHNKKTQALNYYLKCILN